MNLSTRRTLPLLLLGVLASGSCSVDSVEHLRYRGPVGAPADQQYDIVHDIYRGAAARQPPTSLTPTNPRCVAFQLPAEFYSGVPATPVLAGGARHDPEQFQDALVSHIEELHQYITELRQGMLDAAHSHNQACQFVIATP